MYSQIQKYAVYMVCEKEGIGLSGKFKVKQTLRGSAQENFCGYALYFGLEHFYRSHFSLCYIGIVDHFATVI